MTNDQLDAEIAALQKPKDSNIGTIIVVLATAVNVIVCGVAYSASKTAREEADIAERAAFFCQEFRDTAIAAAIIVAPNTEFSQTWARRMGARR